MGKPKKRAKPIVPKGPAVPKPQQQKRRSTDVLEPSRPHKKHKPAGHGSGGHRGSCDAVPAAAAAKGGQSYGAVSFGGQAADNASRHWRCMSVVDQQAAYAVQRLLHADSSRTHGASLKSLTLAPNIVAKKATYAVTCQVIKFASVLRQLEEAVQLTARQPRLSQSVAYVLTYELVRGEGFQRKGPAERAVLAAEAELRAALAKLLAAQGAKAMEDLLPRAAAPAVPHPRWARVNTIKADVDSVIKQLEQELLHQQRIKEQQQEQRKQAQSQQQHDGAIGAGSRSGGDRGHAPPLSSSCSGGVMRDPLLPDLLALPPGTDLHDHPLVSSGQVVLQSKASCMPAHALAPRPGWTVLDCCAAPGNKTTHLAALMTNKGRVVALDKDPKRLARLKANAALTGSSCIDARNADFLSLDPLDPQFAQVRGVLLDPSCSGSGTTFTRLDHLMPSYTDKQAGSQQQAQAAVKEGPGGVAAAQQSGGGGGISAGVPRGSSGSGSSKQKGDKDECTEQQHATQQPAPPTATDGGEAERVDVEIDVEALEQLDQLDPEEAPRVKQLARFQSAALAHALRFPALQRLVYSTCSVHVAENEAVVARALPQAKELGFELADPFPSWPRRGLPLFPGAEKLVRTDAYRDGTDGFFVAVFERRHPSAAVFPAASEGGGGSDEGVAVGAQKAKKRAAKGAHGGGCAGTQTAAAAPKLRKKAPGPA